MNQADLAIRTKESRVKKGMSQEALADKSGLSHRTIQRIEKGEKPYWRDAEKISGGFRAGS